MERTTGFEPATLTLAIRSRVFVGSGQITPVLITALRASIECAGSARVRCVGSADGVALESALLRAGPVIVIFMIRKRRAVNSTTTDRSTTSWRPRFARHGYPGPRR